MTFKILPSPSKYYSLLYLSSFLFTVNCKDNIVRMVVERKMCMVRWWDDCDCGKPTYSEENPSHCHIVHHKSHMDWSRIEYRRVWWEACNYLPKNLLWTNRSNKKSYSPLLTRGFTTNGEKFNIHFTFGKSHEHIRMIKENQCGFTTQLRFQNRQADEDAHDYTSLFFLNKCVLDTNKQINLSEIKAKLR